MISKTVTAVLLAILSLSGCSEKPTVIEQQFVEFGTIFRITLVSTEVTHAQNQIKSIEQRLRQHRHYWHAWEDSDLSNFNQALRDGKPHRIPQSLQTLIRLSKRYYTETDGLFNPALGKLIEAYGFHAKSEPQTPSIDKIKLNLPTMDDLEVEGDKAMSSNAHLSLDLGGIAKGFSIAEVANWLNLQGVENFLINAGGDLVGSGTRGDKLWNVGLQNPFAPGVIAGINLHKSLALFTSGNYQRYYRQGGKIVHHIIDPRTGDPSVQIASATVLHPDPIIADVGATTLMIDGLNNHQEIAKSLGIKHYLIISEDKTIIVTQNLNNKIKWHAKWQKEVVSP